MSFFLAGDPHPCSSCDVGPITCQSCLKGQGHYRLSPMRGWALLVHAAGFLCVTDTFRSGLSHTVPVTGNNTHFTNDAGASLQVSVWYRSRTHLHFFAQRIPVCAGCQTQILRAPELEIFQVQFFLIKQPTKGQRPEGITKSHIPTWPQQGQNHAAWAGAGPSSWAPNDRTLL
jgi:hypothetical protein